MNGSVYNSKCQIFDDDRQSLSQPRGVWGMLPQEILDFSSYICSGVFLTTYWVSSICKS